MDSDTKKNLKNAVRTFKYFGGKPSSTDFILAIAFLLLQIVFFFIYGLFKISYVGGLPIIAYAIIGLVRRRIFSYGRGTIYFEADKKTTFAGIVWLILGIGISYILS